MNRDNEWWERLALLGGWQGWEIGLDEGVQLDLETLDTYVQASYPD